MIGGLYEGIRSSRGSVHLYINVGKGKHVYTDDVLMALTNHQCRIQFIRTDDRCHWKP